MGSRTGKARVLGSSAVIFLQYGNGTACNIGEVDKFSAKELSEIKKSRPLGKKVFASQKDFQGWELSFEGGKVDWKLAAVMQAETAKFQEGVRSPYWKVVQKIMYYDGAVEHYEYIDTTIYDYNLDANGSGDEIGEKFTGFASSRTAMPGPAKDNVTVANTAIDAVLATMVDQQPGALSLATTGNLFETGTTTTVPPGGDF